MVWLNAGDFYQGTVWYTQFKWRVVSLFNNLLDFDAMTLGNHEFDDKIAGLEPFLRNQSTAVVVANINTSLVRAANEPSRSFHRAWRRPQLTSHYAIYGCLNIVELVSQFNI